MTIIKKITYAVGTKHGKGKSEGGLVYATVEREDLAGAEGYIVTSRLGDKIHVGADAIDTLIAALIEARDFDKHYPKTY